MDRKHRRSCIYSTMNAETYYNFAPFVPPPLMPLRSSSTVLTTKSRFACFTLKQMSKPPSYVLHVPSGSLIGFAGQTRKYCMISLEPSARKYMWDLHSLFPKNRTCLSGVFVSPYLSIQKAFTHRTSYSQGNRNDSLSQQTCTYC